MRFIEAIPAGRKTPVVYLELSGIRLGAAPRRLFVGTHNTVTLEKCDAVWQKGLQLRAKMLRLYKAEVRERAMKSRSKLLL